MDWSLTIDLIKLLAGLGAMIGVPLTYLTYRRSVLTKRAEWLVSLHERFFETDRYQSIRRLLDYQQEPEYSELARTIAAGEYHPLSDELYRYLNFFELLASLRQLGQISDKEIVELFDYDLGSLRAHRFIVEALKPQGFEGLVKLLQMDHLLLRR